MLSKLFVHAKEINFGHHLSLAQSCDVYRNAAYEAIKSILFASTYTYQPVCSVSGWRQSPG